MAVPTGSKFRLLIGQGEVLIHSTLLYFPCDTFMRNH